MQPHVFLMIEHQAIEKTLRLMDVEKSRMDRGAFDLRSCDARRFRLAWLSTSRIMVERGYPLPGRQRKAYLGSANDELTEAQVRLNPGGKSQLMKTSIII